MVKSMKKLFGSLALVFFLITSFYAQNMFAQKKVPLTLYEGKLNIQSISLRIVLKIFNNDDGSTTAVLNSPDQTDQDIPVSSITVTDDSIKCEIKTVGGKYSGAIIKDSSLIKGIFTQGGMNLPLTLKKVEKLTEIKRPQNPQKPYPYNEEEVVFENKEAKIKLAGTLTLPKGNGPFPAVVMVTGSGPQDRDETLLNHKPFLVIADHLTRNGIAVLRYDDRGFGKSEGKFAAATSLDFVTDAIAAVDFLKSRNEIDAKKIGVLGHSEGGLIAPIAATQSQDIGFIVLLAGTGVTGKEIIVLQSELISKANGAKTEDLESDRKISDQIYNIIMNENDDNVAKGKILKLLDEYISTLPPEKKDEAEKDKDQLVSVFPQISSLWFRLFLKLDPRTYLENVTIPVLALNGKLDLQVWHEQNLPEIEKALKAGGNKNYKIVALEGLNHLFQHAQTGSPSEYGTIEETFSPDALKIISDWILQTTK